MKKQEVAIAQRSQLHRRYDPQQGRAVVPWLSAACWFAPSQIFASGPLLVAGCGLEAPRELEFEFVVSWHHRKNPNGHGLKRSDLDLEFEIVVSSRH